MATDIIRRPARPSPWRDPAVRGIVFQVLFVAAVVALGAFLVHNTVVNLRRQNIASGFGFLDREAAFGIGESLIPYSPADTYGRAFLVGLLNTLYVAALGIVLATILGTVMGMARLSRNWLIRKLAQIYVETFRNIPLLLQLFFWWGLLRESAPAPRQAWQPLPDVFVSNRGIAFPVPIPTRPMAGWRWHCVSGSSRRSGSSAGPGSGRRAPESNSRPVGSGWGWSSGCRWSSFLAAARRSPSTVPS